jgi:hypothetical protein
VATDTSHLEAISHIMHACTALPFGHSLHEQVPLRCVQCFPQTLDVVLQVQTCSARSHSTRPLLYNFARSRADTLIILIIPC